MNAMKMTFGVGFCLPLLLAAAPASAHHSFAAEFAVEPLFNGDQTAHWEGDTLVIDSISIHERTWIQGNG
jgi:hypothetical protein